MLWAWARVLLLMWKGVRKVEVVRLNGVRRWVGREGGVVVQLVGVLLVWKRQGQEDWTVRRLVGLLLRVKIIVVSLDVILVVKTLIFKSRLIELLTREGISASVFIGVDLGLPAGKVVLSVGCWLEWLGGNGILVHIILKFELEVAANLLK